MIQALLLSALVGLSPPVSGDDFVGAGPYNGFVMLHTVRTPPPFPKEIFHLAVPLPPPTTPQPLLILFHSAAHSCVEPLVSSGLFNEAISRGWYVACNLGGVKEHYSSIPAQIKTEIVLDLILEMLNSGPSPKVDVNRIYGIGFSMGGGAAVNYASRHLDPEHPMFAALICLAGAMSNPHTYTQGPPQLKTILEFWYGTGVPGQIDPFLVTQSSVFDLDEVTNIVDPDTDLARNLLHVPIHIRYAELDGRTYVVEQSEMFASHLTALGHTNLSEHNELGSALHAWSLLDPVWGLDYLQQFTLQLPTSGSTLADRDGRYFQFYVTQDVPEQFTPFTWSVDASSNELVLSDTGNLARIDLQTLAAGLDPAQGIAVTLGASPDRGTSDLVGFTDYFNPPMIVARDSIILTEGVEYLHDPNTGLLTLIETDPGAHFWVIVP